MLGMEPAQRQIAFRTGRLEFNDVGRQGHNDLPIMNHMFGIPTSRQHPFNSPSLSRPQMRLHWSATSSPQIRRIGSRASPYLGEGEYHTSSTWKKTTDPVAKITTSASSVLPSSNARPFGVNPAIGESFFNLILPSMINWLAPTSVSYVKVLFILCRRCIHRPMLTEIITPSTTPCEKKKSGAVYARR